MPDLRLVTRSNYFAVKDPDSFRALMQTIRSDTGDLPEIITDRQVTDEFRTVIKYGFRVNGAIDGSPEFDRVYAKLRELIGPTDACCIVCAGQNGTRAVWLDSYIITRKSVQTVSMKNAVLLTACDMLDDKYWTTSLDVPDGAAGQPLLNGVTEYRVSLKITKEEARRLDAWLENDAHQDEDNVFSRTAVFPDGRQMDIKCCGVQDSEQSSWAEAVLFEPNGQEICCTEPAFEYTGTWELTAKGVRYIVDVTATE